jgi:hypothetical protein
MKTRKASNYLNSVTHQNNSRDAMHPQQASAGHDAALDEAA